MNPLSFHCKKINKIASIFYSHFSIWKFSKTFWHNLQFFRYCSSISDSLLSHEYNFKVKDEELAAFRHFWSGGDDSEAVFALKVTSLRRESERERESPRSTLGASKSKIRSTGYRMRVILAHDWDSVTQIFTEYVKIVKRCETVFFVALQLYRILFTSFIQYTTFMLRVYMWCEKSLKLSFFFYIQLLVSDRTVSFFAHAHKGVLTWKFFLWTTTRASHNPWVPIIIIITIKSGV